MDILWCYLLNGQNCGNVCIFGRAPFTLIVLLNLYIGGIDTKISSDRSMGISHDFDNITDLNVIVHFIEGDIIFFDVIANPADDLCWNTWQ